MDYTIINNIHVQCIWIHLAPFCYNIRINFTLFYFTFFSVNNKQYCQTNLFFCPLNLSMCAPTVTNGYIWLIFICARVSLCVCVHINFIVTHSCFFLWMSDTFSLQAVAKPSPWLHFSAYHCSVLSCSGVLSTHIRCPSPLCTPQITQ